MRVLITGATGLIGSEIVKKCLEKNISVHYLTTSHSKIEEKENYKGFFWDPKKGEIDSSCLQDVDTIIHLAGATISKRWTPQYKTEILESRILSGNILFNAIQKNKQQIKHFISASGVNIYPSDFNKNYTEEANKIDETFLGNVVTSWEEIADKFSVLDIKVSKIRTGMVLNQEEGALPEILKPIKLGAGASLASGKQWQSWIHIEDIARLYVYVLENQLEGVFNAVAPNPVTNKELTHLVAKKLDKTIWLPNVPAFALKLILGEMATLVTSSQKVSSQKIEDKGYQFKFPDLESALNDLL
ncbi:TIGR01777 family oxidoreductase [Planktosalinus lacus]|uniref:NAD-dependent epimerase n=1 Tax=Planktosalinus lacus TaxID=1526573 RepID=A0A8J2VDA2_9FLAO|nr:TIGR01777 family oxidoreductase [Planktosalinus lacus]GGD98296.1 NAD-dependent epimerase [Planktosalinus lacus]